MFQSVFKSALRHQQRNVKSRFLFRYQQTMGIKFVIRSEIEQKEWQIEAEENDQLMGAGLRAGVPF